MLVFETEAKFSPDVDDIVGVFRKLEESTLGSCLSEVTNRKDLSKSLFYEAGESPIYYQTLSPYNIQV
jgi:hypothetical protein